MEATATKATFQKYPAYKESGVEWMGQIPAHWDMLPNKFIFKLKKDLVGKKSNQYTLLSLTLHGIIKRDMENPQGKFPAEFDTYQEVNNGDFVFCLFDVEETPRCVGLSDFDGMITGAYTVMQVGSKFDKRFLYYFYLNLDKDKRLRPLYTGLRNTISKDNFFAFKAFVPPLPEQTAIAAFLDDKTAKIDRAIAQKEKMIALLKERKQIIIQQAVTKGLDPNVKMKDSGVEWIGEVPEGWEVCSVKYVLSIPITDGPHETPILIENGIPFISAESIKNGRIDFSKKRGFISENEHNRFCKKYKPIKGDIYMVKSGATTGNIGIVDVDFEFSIWSPLAVFRAKADVISNTFLYYFLDSFSFKKGVELKWSFGTQQNIGMGVLSNLPIAFPSISDQTAIVTHIETQSAKIDKTIKLQEQQIEKLKELKSTLIDSAVTGKIKVC
jgi:type I restriction enzyme S subunit